MSYGRALEVKTRPVLVFDDDFDSVDSYVRSALRRLYHHWLSAYGGGMAEHIGARIKYWRRRRGGMTQAALAGLAGVSQSYVSQVENGLTGVERRSTLVDFARALQVSVG